MVEEFIRQKIIPCDVHPMRRCFIMQIVITLASSIGSQHRSGRRIDYHYYLAKCYLPPLTSIFRIFNQVLEHNFDKNDNFSNLKFKGFFLEKS